VRDGARHETNRFELLLGLQPGAALAQATLGFLVIGPQAGLAQGPLHRGHEALQLVLGDEVLGAGAQVADRVGDAHHAGEHDQRCVLGADAEQVEGPIGGVIGDGDVAEDHAVGGGAERRLGLIAVGGAVEEAFHPPATQGAHDERGVVVVIFDEQDPKGHPGLRAIKLRFSQ
jgi:hypothetical protein